MKMKFTAPRITIAELISFKLNIPVAVLMKAVRV